MFATINQFFTTFGAPVMVPVLLLIIARSLRVPWGQAAQSALAAGVGLTGFSWLISAFTPLVTKLIHQLVNSAGIQRPVVDLGWQTGSLAAFSAPVGLAVFGFSLLLELLLFALGYTRIFMPANLWNNFGFMLWATMAYTATHNLGLALGLAAFLILITLLLAEVQAPAWSTYYQVPHATVAAVHNIEQVVPILILDPLFNRLGLDKCRFNPAHAQAKLGALNEPMVLGALLGASLGILANFKRLTHLAAWGQISQFTIQLAAIMALFPLVTQVFARAFAPLAAAIDRQPTPAKKRGPWFLAVDDGVGYGETTTLFTGMVLLPVLVLIAFGLPGNQTLPVVDLIALPFMIESIVALTRGNFVKIVLTAVIWFSLGLYAASWLAPIYTATVAHYGTALPAGVLLITSFNLVARPLNALIFAAFISANPLWIGLACGSYLIASVAFRRHRTQVWAYLARQAARNQTA